MINTKDGRGMYIFIKLKDKENYKVQAQKMSFILWNTGLINYINSIVVKPIFYTKFEYKTISKEKIKKKNKY